MKCACKAYCQDCMTVDLKNQDIEFCPLHKAAEILVNEIINHLYTKQDIERVRNLALIARGTP